MIPTHLLASLIATAASALLLYLSSSHQRWLRAPLSPRMAYAGWLLLPVGAVCWIVTMSPVAGFFAWLTELMLLLAAMPLLGLLRSPIGNARA